jgi:glutathione synthase
MSLAVALQMDPIQTINFDTDSSFVLGLEAQKRGYKLYHYLPENLTMDRGKIKARVKALTLYPNRESYFSLGQEDLIDLSVDMDVVLLRQDPPFDLAYITTTHLLDHIHPKTLVVNDPSSVRNSPEKLLVTYFQNLMPPTLITSDIRLITEFRKEYKDIIVKPLYGNGGSGVFHISPEDENLFTLIELYQNMSREPLMIQRYQPEVRQGDKRIILIDGRAVGALNRVPAKGDARSNMHVGGKAEKTLLTDRDLEICETIGPLLREKGLLFVGIDVIGDYLTEINVTSPTGLQVINRLDHVCLESQIWDAIEMKI